MAALGLRYSVIVDLPSRVFGIQKTPPWAQHDQMSIVASRSGYRLQNLKIYPQVGICILQPVPLLAPTLAGNWAVNSGSGQSQIVDAGTDSEYGVPSIGLPDASADQTFDYSMTSSVYQNACFYLRASMSTPAPGATRGSDTIFRAIRVGDGTPPSQANGGTPFALVFPFGQRPYLQQGIPNPDGSDTWFWDPNLGNSVQSLAIQRTEDLWNANARVLTIEWLPIPSENTLLVTVASDSATGLFIYRAANQTGTQGVAQYGQNSLTYKYGNNLSVCAGAIRDYGQNGAVTLQFFPMRFATSGTFTSDEIQLPFTWQGNWFLDFPNSQVPPNTSIVSPKVGPTDYTSTNLAYSFTLQAQADDTGLAPESPIITDALLYIPGTSYFSAFVGQPADISPYVSDIVERQWVQRDELDEDRMAVSIRTQVGLKLANYNGAIVAPSGAHRAVQYSRNLTAAGANGLMQDLTEPVTFITGWAGHSDALWRKDPQREFDLIIDDGAWQLERRDMPVTVFGDGWVDTSFLRFLAAAGGIEDNSGQWMDPLFYRYGLGANPPNSDGVFKLATGIGTSPKEGFSPSTKFWRAMLDIASYQQWVLFFDALRVLRAFPYFPGAAMTPFKGFFSTLDFGEPNDSSFLMSLWNKPLRVRVDTSNRRTGLIFGGLDPATNMVDATVRNADDYAPGFTEFVHGFIDPWVQISNRFVDPDFTNAYADMAIQRVMLPGVMADSASCFLPGLFALDQYAVYEPNYVIGGTIFLSAEEVMNEYHNDGRHIQMGGNQTGRWIANL